MVMPSTILSELLTQMGSNRVLVRFLDHRLSHFRHQVLEQQPKPHLPELHLA